MEIERMKMTLLFATLSVFTALTAAAEGPNVNLAQGENKIDVTIDGKPFATYTYGDAQPKPTLIHIKTSSGIEVSRRHPLTDIPPKETR